MFAIRFEQVSRTFGSVKAVDRVSFAIGDGEFFTFLGPSGSGKTTCLRLIAGFESPSSGTIELFGRDVSSLPPYERDVNTVFQDYALFPHMSVAENVAYGLMVKKVPKPERDRRVQETLDLVRLPGIGERRPAQLSGGQKQRVALARALINHPKVLLLDEPLGALDLKLRQQMQVELKSIQNQVGITFLYVTHDQEEALTMSDRIAVFNQGGIEQIGSPAELYERPQTEFVAGFIGTTNLLSGDLALALSGSVAPFAIRPEQIQIAQTEIPADCCAVDGVVQDAAYLGSALRYQVVAREGAILTVLQPRSEGSDRTLLPGEAVRLFWPKRLIWRIPD